MEQTWLFFCKFKIKYNHFCFFCNVRNYNMGLNGDAVFQGTLKNGVPAMGQHDQNINKLKIIIVIIYNIIRDIDFFFYF
jgi:hypothetical protein